MSARPDSLSVRFPPGATPPPAAFASFSVAHRIIDHFTLDFGYLDPMRMRPAAEGGIEGELVHVSRLILPLSAVARLHEDLGRLLGEVRAEREAASARGPVEPAAPEVPSPR